MQSNRLGTDISFSDAGGVEIEENWDKVKQISVPTGEDLTGEMLAPLLVDLPLELRGNMEKFIQACFGVRLQIRKPVCVAKEAVSTDLWVRSLLCLRKYRS
jgi:hypothetical protein